MGGWNSLIASSNISAAFPSPLAVGANGSVLSMLQLASMNPASDPNSILQALARSQTQPGSNVTQLLLQVVSGNNSTRNLLHMLCESNPANAADSLAALLRNSGSNSAYLSAAASPSLSASQLLNAASMHQAFQNVTGSTNLVGLSHLFAQNISPQQPHLPNRGSNSPSGMASSSPDPQPASFPGSSNNDVASNPAPVDNVLRSKSSEAPQPSSEESILLYRTADDTKLSPYQCKYIIFYRLLTLRCLATY
jgi:hypothetical protein